MPVHRPSTLVRASDPVSPSGGPVRLQAAVGSRVVAETLLLLVDLAFAEALRSGKFPIWLPIDRQRLAARSRNLLRFRDLFLVFLVFLVFYFASLLRRSCVGYCVGRCVAGKTDTLIFIVFADSYDVHTCVGRNNDHAIVFKSINKPPNARLGPAPFAGEKPKRGNNLPAVHLDRSSGYAATMGLPCRLRDQPQPSLAPRKRLVVREEIMVPNTAIDCEDAALRHACAPPPHGGTAFPGITTSAWSGMR